jgi:uncharacterized protein (DUF1697 family)
MSYVALLRAVNVGGTRLPMAELRSMLEGLGLRNVRTYLQSGNAVFDAGPGDGSGDPRTPLELATAVEVRIERDPGPRVGVLVFGAEDMLRAVAANPFLGNVGPACDEKSLHATFLFGREGEADEAPEPAYSAVYEAAFSSLELPAGEGEEAAFVGAPPLAKPVVYLRLPHGYGRTKLTNAYFERKLGTAATTRNWRTVVALAEMATGKR